MTQPVILPRLNTRTIVLTLLVLNQSALAGSPTLERIRNTHMIQLGFAESVIPMSWFDKEQKKPRGYALEISEEIVERLKPILRTPDLKIKYVLVPSKDRWKMHANGDIDLYCSVTTNTIERQEKLVSFSHSYYVAHAKMLVKKSSGIKGYRDLAGKDVAVMGSAASARFLQSKKSSLKIKNFKVINTGLSDAFTLLKNDEVAALVYDDISLLSFLLRHPEEKPHFEIVGKPLTTENYGCTMQHQDTAFKELVNRVLGEMIIDRKVHQLYDKWFMNPIPPLNLNLHLPMSSEIEKLLSMPNDKAVGQFN